MKILSKKQLFAPDMTIFGSERAQVPILTTTTTTTTAATTTTNTTTTTTTTRDQVRLLNRGDGVSASAREWVHSTKFVHSKK